MNTLDLLNEISTSPLSKRTDNQLAYAESKMKYSYETIYPIWDDHYNNFVGKESLREKWGIQQQTFMKYCKAYGLPMRTWEEMKNQGVVYNAALTGRDAQHKRMLKNPRVIDIINGMDSKTWKEKHQCNDYGQYKHRLRKHGLVD